MRPRRGLPLPRDLVGQKQPVPGEGPALLPPATCPGSFWASPRLRSSGSRLNRLPGHPPGDGRSGRRCGAALYPDRQRRRRDGKVRCVEAESERWRADQPGAGTYLSHPAPSPPACFVPRNREESCGPERLEETSLQPGRAALAGAHSRVLGPVKVSPPELQGARCRETLPRARTAESLGSLEGLGTPGRREPDRNRGQG